MIRQTSIFLLLRNRRAGRHKVLRLASSGRFALPLLLSISLWACSDAAAPTEPPEHIATTSTLLSSAVPSPYVAIDLGTLGGVYSTATDVNDAGQVVGTSLTADDEFHPFLWDGSMQDLGTLSGPHGDAWAINASGSVVGTSGGRGFLWDGSEMRDLGSLGGGHTRADDISDAGVVVGSSQTTLGGPLHAFSWDGELHEHGTFEGGSTFVHGSNEHGQFVGAGYFLVDGITTTLAYLWDDGMHGIGTLGGEFVHSSALAINNLGQVVGETSTRTGEGRAFLWDGTMHDLGIGQSFAWDINDRGQIVGRVTQRDEHGSIATVPFVWDGVIHILPHLGGGGGDARAISESGLIVGTSTTASGEQHATLWRPATPAERLEQCAAAVSALESEGVLNRGQARSLTGKIEGALASLAAERPKPAANKLRAFQNEVRALERSRRLSSEEAEILISCVQGVGLG